MTYILATRKQRTPQWNRVRRNGRAPSGVCVIHTAEGNGASNVVNWILNRPDYGSYHRIVDATSTLKLAPWSAETFHCRFTNPHSVGISAAVFAKDWKKHYARGNTPGDAPSSDGSKIIDRMAREAADFVNYMKGRGVTVPIKRITRTQALNGTPGFLAHGDTDPGRRTDPGKDFDWSYFFRRINVHLGRAPKPAPPKPAQKPTPPKPAAPAPALKPTPKPEPAPKKEFLMALTDKEQRSLLADSRKLKTATERNERRAEEMLEYLSIIASAVTDSEKRGTLRHRVEQTNAAVGRAEKARQEAAAEETEESDNE